MLTRYSSLLFSLACLLTLLAHPSPSGAEQKQPEMKLAPKVEKEYGVKSVAFSTPFMCAFRPFANPIPFDSIEVYGIKVTTKKEEKEIEVSWGSAAPVRVKSGGVVKVVSEAGTFPIGFAQDKSKDWGYYYAEYREAKVENRIVRFFDMDCNGTWLDKKTDALMLGDKVYVVPIMPTQWFYEWHAEFEFSGAGKEMKLKAKLSPIELYPSERRAGEILNNMRGDMGLPLLPMDKELSRKARLFAKYITAQGGDLADWAKVRDPRPEYLGYTPEAVEMKNSIFHIFDGAVTAIEDLMGQFYHRAQFFWPDTRVFGLGEDGAVSVYNGEMTRDLESIKWQYPLCIPAPEQTIKYLDYYGKYGGETPDPRPAGSGGSWPISMQWAPTPEKLEIKKARLFTVAGAKETEINCFGFGPNRPAQATLPANEGMLLILADRSFKNNTRYHVVVEYAVDGKDLKTDWYFNTGQKK
ncbi:MAG: hypothetical protein WC712_06705 [Candidatus Brocadiia bacterium]